MSYADRVVHGSVMASTCFLVLVNVLVVYGTDIPGQSFSDVIDCARYVRKGRIKILDYEAPS